MVWPTFVYFGMIPQGKLFSAGVSMIIEANVNTAGD